MEGYVKRLAAATGTEGPLRRIRDAGKVLKDGKEPTPLDYPVHPEPRWGYDKPGHPELTRIIEAGRAGYADLLAKFLGYGDRFTQIQVKAASENDRDPAWRNAMIPALDSISLYSLLALEDPRLYLEIGSGNSTKFARRSIRDNDLATKIVSIDPHPRAECDDLCDEIIREPFENVDLSVFDRVGAGDIVFLDGSHRSLTNSDATAFFLDVLPRLPPGAIVQIHDIYLPDDYPPALSDRFYSEQYLLAAWLLAGGPDYEIVLPNKYVSDDEQLHAILDPVWRDPRLAGIESYGCSFWLRRRHE